MELPVWNCLSGAAYLRLLECRAMRSYSPGRGRKRAIKKFTTRKGLWMAAMIAAGMIAMVVLWLLGVFRLDAD
jgi:hypothetical protein